MMKLIEEDEKPIFKTNTEKNDIQLNIVAADKQVSETIIDKKITDLVTKYKQKVTEEKQEGESVVIIKRIVVRDQETWVYEKRKPLVGVELHILEISNVLQLVLSI